jgi:mono/diheme cytochrome c family protein
MTSSFLVATAVERAGFFIAAASVVAWLIYAIVTFRLRDPDAPPGAEIELAPNRRPYFDDETLEGRRLDKALVWALVLLVISSAGPLVYWLNEPSRQAGAIQEFDSKAVNRGHSLFQPTDSPEHGAHFGCATCHGPKGAGASTDFIITDFLGATRSVQWQAPALDTALLKFSPDEVRKILVYGRANTPMPAWGVEGGGPMNAQQIDDLVAYIGSITISPKEAQARALEEATAQANLDGTSPADGATLFKTNCARCHTKGWSYGEPEVQGGGAFGPNLTNGATIRQFPDLAAMIAFISEGSEYGKPYGVRGQGGDEGGGMPGFRMEKKEILTAEQIRAIVEYERSL